MMLGTGIHSGLMKLPRAKEMKDVRVAFKILDNGKMATKGYQFVKCHMVFDIEMEDVLAVRQG